MDLDVDHRILLPEGVTKLSANTRGSLPRVLRDTPFEVIHFNIPRATLNAFTEDAELPNVESLHCPEGQPDPVLYHLAGNDSPVHRSENRAGWVISGSLSSNAVWPHCSPGMQR
jgi:hypothetical protein